MDIRTNIYAYAIYIMYNKKEINLFTNLVDRIKSWWVLVHTADDLNNERLLNNWGLNKQKQTKIKKKNKNKKMNKKGSVLRTKVILKFNSETGWWSDIFEIGW